MNYKTYIALFLIMPLTMHASDGHKKKIKKTHLPKEYMKLPPDDKLRLLTFDFAAVYELISQMSTELTAVNESLAKLNAEVLKLNGASKKAYEKMGSIALELRELMNSGSTTEESSGGNSNNSGGNGNNHRDQPKNHARPNRVVDDLGGVQLSKFNRSHDSVNKFDAKRLLHLKKTTSTQQTQSLQTRSFKQRPNRSADGIHVIPRKGGDTPRTESLGNKNDDDITIINITNMDMDDVNDI